MIRHCEVAIPAGDTSAQAFSRLSAFFFLKFGACFAMSPRDGSASWLALSGSFRPSVQYLLSRLHSPARKIFFRLKIIYLFSPFVVLISCYPWRGFCAGNSHVIM